MVPAVYPEKKLPPKGGGFHFFKKGGDTSQVGDDLKRGDPTPWDKAWTASPRRQKWKNLSDL